MRAEAETVPFLRLQAYTQLPQNDEDEDSSPTKVQSETDSENSHCSRLYHRWLDGEFTIVPDETRLLDAWDATVLAALTYTGLVLPFEMAFFQGAAPPTLAATDGLMYWVFVLDMFLTFMVAFPVSRGLSTNMYERAPIKILKNYMAVPFGWFWMDLLTITPWHLLTGSDSTDMIRCCRIVCIMRLVRLMKLAGRWHSRVGMSYAVADIMKCVAITLAFMHWLSCVWGCLAVIGHTQDSPTWYSLYVGELEDGMKNFAVHDVYATAVYFIAATVTGVGFGDIAPKNLEERVLATLTIFCAGFMWAGVVAIIVNVVTNWDPYANDFQKLSDNLNMLMESRGLPNQLRTRARKHIHESYEIYRHRSQRETIKALSPGLQVEFAIASGQAQVMECVSFLRGVGEEVVSDLVSFLEPEMYSPYEFVIDRSCVSVIRWGSCWWKVRLITRDAVIGEDMILSSTILKDPVRPKTLTYVELLSLSRADLGKLCAMFPHFNVRVRLAQVRMAVRRGVVAYAKRLKKAQDRKEQTDVSKMTVRAIENDAQCELFHQDQHAQMLDSHQSIVHELKSVSSELRMLNLQEVEKRSRGQPVCSYEQKENRQEISTATQHQATCCCSEVLEAIDRLARVQEQLRQKIDEALAERRMPHTTPMNNPPRTTNPSDTEVLSNLNDELMQASCTSSSSVPGQHSSSGETGGSRDALQQLSSLGMEAQFDALASKLTRSVSAGPSEAGDQSADGQLAWRALFEKQSAKIDGLKSSVDHLWGQVRRQDLEAMGRESVGASLATGCREDESVSRYRRLSQQRHPQSLQQWQKQPMISQLMPSRQQGQAVIDIGLPATKNQFGSLGHSQPVASWEHAREDRTASWPQPARKNNLSRKSTSPV